MRHTKITAFIALTAVSAFLLVLSFTPPAGGETHSAAVSAPADVQTTSAPLPQRMTFPNQFASKRWRCSCHLTLTRCRLLDR